MTQQQYICKKCGAANQEGQYFCTSCGEKLASNCPACGENLLPGLNFCPFCGIRLIEEKETETLPSKNMKEMLHDLHMIAVFKEGLPGEQQDWCNILGLHVQYRELDRYTHGIEGVWVKAGSRYRTHLEGWTDNKKIFEITKYNPGNWESLIGPTLEVAKWLYDHGGLKVEDREVFKKAIDAFRKTGILQLPA